MIPAGQGDKCINPITQVSATPDILTPSIRILSSSSFKVSFRIGCYGLTLRYYKVTVSPRQPLILISNLPFILYRAELALGRLKIPKISYAPTWKCLKPLKNRHQWSPLNSDSTTTTASHKCWTPMGKDILSENFIVVTDAYRYVLSIQ